MYFTVSAPEHPHLGKVVFGSLRDAIKTKRAWMENQNAYAIITDKNGYVVSAQEQKNYMTFSYSSFE